MRQQVRRPALAIPQKRYGQLRPRQGSVFPDQPDLEAQGVAGPGPQLLKRCEALRAVLIRRDLLDHQAADFFARIADDLGKLRIAAENVALRGGMNNPHRSLLKEISAL